VTHHSAEQDALTEEQVAALPEGTPVTVIWSGGNGPHNYVIAVDQWGQRYAATIEDPDDRMRFYNFLRFTGVQRFNTRVWTRVIPPGKDPAS